MKTIPHHVCGVIPPHILDRVAEHSAGEAADDARSTLQQMRELERERMRSFVALDETATAEPAISTSKKRRSVYDAQHQQHLPGKLVMSEHKPRSADVEVDEAYDGSGATFDFYA